ncbi:ISNCY family transposase, partial [Xanthomonas citri pv. citri]
MGWLSMATRKELTVAAGVRYRRSDRAKKARILDEFADITGFHRKHAMRLLRGQEDVRPSRRARRRIYYEAEHNALVLLW